jgi:transposase
MSASGRGYPAELRERAVRLVFEHQGEYPSQWKAIVSVAEKLHITPETLRVWIRRAETDSGARPGLSTSDRERLHDLEREVKELRRANEILKAASAFFARELDPRPPR